MATNNGTFSNPRSFLPPAKYKKLQPEEVKASADRLSTRHRKDVDLPPLVERRVLTADVMGKSLDRLYTSSITGKKRMMEELDKKAHPDMVKHHQLAQDDMEGMFNRLYTASMQRKEDTLKKLRGKYLHGGPEVKKLDKGTLSESATRLCNGSIDKTKENSAMLFEKYVVATAPKFPKLTKDQIASSADRLSKKG